MGDTCDSFAKRERRPYHWRFARYGLVHDPFDKEFINKLIISYLQTFVSLNDWSLLQSWHGIYPKMTTGQTEFIIEAQPGVTIINGLGGNGMTLSFGLCEEFIAGRKS